jgi:competence protein ComEC
MDSDHVNGVLEILEDEGCGIKIRNVVISPGAVPDTCSPASDDNGNYSRLTAAAKKRDTRILVMSAGDCLTFDGPGKRCMKLDCLSPKVLGGKNTGTFAGTDENDASLVLKLEYDDFTALFTGDISENVEEAILNDVPDCDYLKVAHHGSRYSSSEGFLNKAAPEMSVISAGVDNSYGHPHKETLERLKECKTKVFCTQSCGEIITLLDEGKLSVRRFLSK